MRPALGARFLSIGRVQSAGKLLTVCTGEVRAYASAGDAHKVVAMMQATIVNVVNGPAQSPPWQPAQGAA